MAGERTSGQTRRATKDFGKMIKLMAREHSSTWMGIFLRATGSRTRHVDMASTLMSMGLSTRESGKTTSRKDMALKLGQISRNSRDIILLEKKMEEVNTTSF